MIKQITLLATAFLAPNLAIANESDLEKLIAIQQAQLEELQKVVGQLQKEVLPSKAVMAFNLKECPTGWSVLSGAQGRTLVGLNNNGSLLGSVGPALKDLENKAHKHTVNPPKTSTSLAGSHSHSVNPPSTTTSYVPGHSHVWSRISNKDWYTFNSSGSSFKITDWDNGIDNKGEGIYPLASGSDGLKYTTKAGDTPIPLTSDHLTARRAEIISTL